MNSKRMTQVLIVTFVLVSALSFFVLADEPSAQNGIIHVAADGTEDYTTIQQAIDNASDGDTIIVEDGTYYENVVINKSINLVGENAVIDGGNTGNVVSVIADETNVSGFIIKNGGCGINVSSGANYTTIKNCEIVNNSGEGIVLSNVSNIKVTGCKVGGGNIGIAMSGCKNSTITDCVIFDNSYGVSISAMGNHTSDSNLIYHNDFIGNTNSAYDECNNTWDNETLQEGNYWSDFDESGEGAWDNNSDGIVDSPYPIPGGSNVDNYPLINQIDLFPPSTSCVINGTQGNHGWFTGNVSVTLLPSDNLSGVNYTLYRIDGGQWTEYNGPFNISNEGAHDVDYYSVDTAGNKERIRHAEVNIDKSSPSIECYLQPGMPDGNNGWYTGNVEVTLSADDNASGVESIMYRIDQNTWRDYNGYFLLTVEGNHTFTFYAKDYAGHEVTKATNIKIDKTSPSVSVVAPAQDYVKGIFTIKWNASDNVDDDLNGSISLYLIKDNESTEIASGLNNTGTYEWNTFSFDDGSYALKVVATDEAGNNGSNVSQPFILDNLPPAITIDQPRGGEVLGGGQNLVIFWNASDDIDKNLDGTIWISYSRDGSVWKNIVERTANSGKYTYGISEWDNGNYMVRINATDDAGNTGWAVSGNFTVDKTPPSVTIKRPESGYLYLNIAGREIIPPIPISFVPLPYNTVVVGKITVEISATDDLSGIDHIDINAGGAKKTIYGNGGSSYEYKWNTPIGKCDLSVVAYDMAGNSEEDELDDIFCINL
ncbi:MAG: hypothetical protein DRN17_01720 [Thermoplasmata archaeon]|nr:MAG: hypothetical protein DRN17_01720 [Thermoplasmata archaeon]